MNPKLGTVLGYLGSSLLKAMEVVDFEQRLERLEETSHGLASPLEKLDERVSAEVGCICFPPDEPPELQLKAEVESRDRSYALCTVSGLRKWRRRSGE